MPELPEMETYKRLLEQKILFKPIQEIEINREKSINTTPSAFINQVKGSHIYKIERRAKHLLFYLHNQQVLLLHLMLGGYMFLGFPEQKPDRTTQVELNFGGLVLYFIGLRLGYLHLYKEQEIAHTLKALGPEPLAASFTFEEYKNTFEKKRGVLKSTLVNQQLISGIGNCYSDEICFDAGLLPMRKINELSIEEHRLLYQSIQQVLETAISYGGYMEAPLFVGDELTGGYNAECLVYDREGEPCHRCSSPIIRDEITSRKSFYCTGCQR